RPRGNEIVVVQIDAVGAELCQLADDRGGGKRWPHRLAERVAPRIADGPQPEREVMLGPGLISVLAASYHPGDTRLDLTCCQRRQAWSGNSGGIRCGGSGSSSPHTGTSGPGTASV